MTDSIVIPFGTRLLVLDPDQLDRALRRGDAFLPATTSTSTSTENLLSSQQMQDRTGVPATWWMAQAREHRIPHVRIGRRVRFDFKAVSDCEAFRRRAIPVGGLVGDDAGLPNRRQSKT